MHLDETSNTLIRLISYVHVQAVFPFCPQLNSLSDNTSHESLHGEHDKKKNFFKGLSETKILKPEKALRE